MKGIILAGGAGSRLYPLTSVATKQLQGVYDKPMIYYPLSVLMLGGIREILLITTSHDQPNFKKLLGDGSHLGLRLEYRIQDDPRGLPEAFIIGESFIGNDDCCLILGDNIFYGDLAFFRRALISQTEKTDSQLARVFAYYVSDPRAYGVVEFDKHTKKVKSIEEKPSNPKSNFAIPGLYLFDSSVCKRAKNLTRSNRNETEIVDLILDYHRDHSLAVEAITRGVAWLDTGTPRSLLDAAAFIGAIEERQGLKVACLEEVAYRAGLISLDKLQTVTDQIPRSPYRAYLERIISES